MKILFSVLLFAALFVGLLSAQSQLRTQIAVLVLDVKAYQAKFSDKPITKEMSKDFWDSEHAKIGAVSFGLIENHLDKESFELRVEESAISEHHQNALQPMLDTLNSALAKLP